MKYLKYFESKVDIEGELKDLFIHLEEAGYSVCVSKENIVKDRDDWTGNLICTKLRNVYGDKFISYHRNVIMQKGGKRYSSEEVTMVMISRISYIKDLTDKKIYKHWEKIDNELMSEIEVIQKRCESIVKLKLYGIMAGWYQMGTASHSDYLGRPYYGYDTLSDFYMIAFTN